MNLKKHFLHLYHSFFYSFDGIKAAFQSEIALRQEILTQVLLAHSTHGYKSQTDLVVQS